MKGIILAGGEGTRLRPFTYVTNKHLANVHESVMIGYPLETLVNAGINDILIVCGDHQSGQFLELLSDGSGINERLKMKYDNRIKITYRIQRGNPNAPRGAFGIANALSLAEDFADDERIAVILGDNFFEDNIKEHVKNFEKSVYGAKIFLKKVNLEDAHKFGIAEIVDGKINSIEEKPKQPKSNLAVSGLYFYDDKVFEIIKKLKPSERGEYEITDVNNFYLKNNNLEFEILKGHWGDMGTHESRFRIERFLVDKYGFSK